MMGKPTIALLLMTALLIGCNGQLYSGNITASGDEKAQQKGVIAYKQMRVVEVSEYRAVVEGGKVVRTSEGRSSQDYCKPTATHKVSVTTDYGRPYRIWYEAGVMETNKFSVSLQDGVVTSVNTESEPDRGQTLKNLSESISPFVLGPDAIVGLEPRPELRKFPCTHLPQLKAVFRLQLCCLHYCLQNIQTMRFDTVIVSIKVKIIIKI